MNIKNKERFEKIIAVIVPIIFLAYGLIKSAKGIELADSGYNYGNFKNLSMLDGMWLYSTYLSNVLGALFTGLPFGNIMLGMNIYCGILKCIIPIAFYYFLTGTKKIKWPVAFFGELAALGLCWCPVALIYNYLTYLLFGACIILLISGLLGKKSYLLFFAGIVLGLNVFTRLPNICECALILIVIGYSVFEKEKVSECIKKSLICIGGFAAAVVVMLLIAGPSAYINGISELFGATKEATEYSPLGMIGDILAGYKDSLFYLIRTAGFLIGIIIISILIPVKLKKIRFAVTVILSTLFLYYMETNSLFGFEYDSLGAVFQFAVLWIDISIIVFITAIIDKNTGSEMRLLSLAGLTVILITPIGSNNGLYPVLNNMFLIFPVSIQLVYDYSRKEISLIKGRLKGDMFFGSLGACIVMLIISCLGTGMFCLFNDKDANYWVEFNPVLAGMNTNETLVHELTGLSGYYQGITKDGNTELLLYGNIPALMYYLDGEPAISSTWPDLDSYSSEKFEISLDTMDDYPVIMIGQGSLLYDIEDLTSEVQSDLSNKEKILLEYIKNNNYSLDYVNQIAKVYIVK